MSSGNIVTGPLRRLVYAMQFNANTVNIVRLNVDYFLSLQKLHDQVPLCHE